MASHGDDDFDDGALERFGARMLVHYGFRTEERPAVHRKLVLVTEENAHKFRQPATPGGRKPKPASATGNVVLLGARAKKREPAPLEDDDAATQAFYDRLNALPIGALTTPPTK